MAWGSSVILLLNLAETWIEYEEDGELVSEEIESEAFNNLNAWLKTNGFGELVDLTLPAFRAGDRSMQSLVYGGAFNHLDEEDFVNIVREQQWRDPKNVQILVMSEFAEKYTLHILTKRRSATKQAAQLHFDFSANDPP